MSDAPRFMKSGEPAGARTSVNTRHRSPTGASTFQ